MPQTIHTLLIQYLSEIQKIYGAHVTYSRHLNLTDFEVGASCSIALQAKLKQAIPACPAVLFYPVTDLFCAIMHIFYIFFFLLSEY